MLAAEAQLTSQLLQVHYASTLAAESVSGAALLAHQAVRVPVDAVAKPVTQLRSLFESSDSSRSDDGHALQPLLSSFQHAQGHRADRQDGQSLTGA
jgi:hypothetical protein